MATHTFPSELRAAALYSLQQRNTADKVEQVNALAQAWQHDRLSLVAHASLTAPAGLPGHPEKPALVKPREVKRRSMNTVEGRATMIHALAHIEFNAINLALDAIWRFSDLPVEFYSDWLQVAHEEAQHFKMLDEHLQTLGYRYGDFPAHNGLWDMAARTAHDVLARMALVPRTLEARGLDVTPGIRDKLAQAGDLAAAEILTVILRDEVGHVMLGNRWYQFLCAERDLDPTSTFIRLMQEYSAPALHKPLNLVARKQAGFSDTELSGLSKNYNYTI